MLSFLAQLCVVSYVRYFRLPLGYDGASVDDDEALMNSADAVYCWTHSGWVPDEVVNPLVNFAEPPCNVYLRRELNSWTDSVKLRYGLSTEDCPALWARAAEYAELTAGVFHGVRLDNCHSTPLHVAEHVLRAARRVRPDLYVFAELYAGGETAACRVANCLGLNATIEVALSAHSARQLAERVSSAGDVPLGAFVARRTDWLTGRRRPPLILFDQSHDDDSPLRRRTYLDPLPSASVLSVAPSPVGSNRGYDELVPRAISVITETRLYRKWRRRRLDLDDSGCAADGPQVAEAAAVKSESDDDDDLSAVDFNTGLIDVRRALNELRVRLADEGFNEVGTELLDDDVVVVTRRHAATQRSVVTVAHTAFYPRHCDSSGPVKSLQVPGVVDEICLEASVVSWSPNYRDHDGLIVGLSDYRVETRMGVSVCDSRVVRVLPRDDAASCDTVELVNCPPGCVVVIAVTLTTDAVRLLDQLVQLFNTWIWDQSSVHGASIQHHIQTQFTHPDSDWTAAQEDLVDPTAEVLFSRLVTIVSSLREDEWTRVLYDAETDRRPSGDGFTVYHVPGHGDLEHCGLTGVASLLSDMRRQHTDRANHPLAANLRHGDWLMDYIVARLAAWPGTVCKLSAWFQRVFDLVKTLPRCLVPCYFEAVVSAVHVLVANKASN